MEVLKTMIFFVSLACLTFGKFIEPEIPDASERLEDTEETSRDDESLSSQLSFQDYLSRFLETPAADPSYSNLCKTTTQRTKSTVFLEETGETKIHPDHVVEKFCVTGSNGEPHRCGQKSDDDDQGYYYCMTQTEYRMFYVQRPHGECGRWIRRRKKVRVGCSCCSRT